MTKKIYSVIRAALNDDEGYDRTVEGLFSTPEKAEAYAKMREQADEEMRGEEDGEVLYNVKEDILDEHEADRTIYCSYVFLGAQATDLASLVVTPDYITHGNVLPPAGFFVFDTGSMSLFGYDFSQAEADRRALELAERWIKVPVAERLALREEMFTEEDEED